MQRDATGLRGTVTDHAVRRGHMAAPARTPDPLTFAPDSPHNQRVDTGADLLFSLTASKLELPQIRPTHKHFPSMET